MAGFDVLRWRKRRGLPPMSAVPLAMSAAGRDMSRYGRDDEPRLILPSSSGGDRALTASASLVPVGDRRQAQRARYARQGWQCVDPETEALTRDGWRAYTALAVGDEILTLDLTSGSSVWRPIQRLNVYNVVDAEMLSMEGRLHSSLSTLNHRWPVMRRQATARLYDCEIPDCGRQGFARRLCAGHYNQIRRNGRITGPVTGRSERRAQRLFTITTSAEMTARDSLITAAPCSELPGNDYLKWTDALVEVVAWFWTEGHAKRQASGFYGVIAQSHRVNPTYEARIRAALTDVYGPARASLRDLSDPGWREWIGDDGMTTFGLNIPAMRILAEAIDLPSKIVKPSFVLSLTRSQLELFIQTSVDADGHRTALGTGIVSQSVRERLAGLELAAVLTGRTPHTYWSASDGKRGGRWVLHLRDKATVNPQGSANRSDKAAVVERRTGYTGVVWCPTVETGTWFARRHGTVYVTSNSEAYAYLDGVGELRYAVQTSANAVSRLRLYPAIQLDPKEPPVSLDEVGANDVPASVVAAAMEDLALLSDPGHGLSAMQHTQSINKQIVGEYYIVGLPFDPDTGEESWSVRSIDEVIVDTDGQFYLRDRPPGFQGYEEPPLPLGPDTFVARCWDPHPRFRGLAWSQMRPLLESLEELLLASRMIRSTLRSRIAGAGILLVPDELELLGIDPTNQDMLASPFFEELAKAMLTPIQSEGDASEVVPMVVRGPAEILKELRHLTLDRPIDQHAMAIRGELIRRLAIGIDWPPELLLGVGDVSHWAQWFVDESTFRYHYEPQAISSVRQWTQGFAQPMLLAREWDGPSREIAEKVVWWYDPTELLTHPDRTKDAIQLHTMDVLNDDALLRAAGFDPDTDKPTEADFLVRMMSKFRSFPPNIVEAIVHRFDPSLDIPADKNEPGEGPGGETPIEEDKTPPSGGGPPAAPAGGNPGRSGPPEQQAAAAISRLLGLTPERSAMALTASTPPVNDGAMLALYPTAEQAAALALDDGESPDELHVTLAYLGKAADLTAEQVEAARTVASSVAGLHAPLSGTYSGVARFTGTDEGLDPVVATPDVQGLAPLRNMLCEHLAATGVPMPSEHGWTPHTTLAYVAPDAPMPIDRLDPVPADFDAISLVIAGDRTDYPLAGTAEPLVAATAPARVVHEGASRKLAAIDRSLRERIRTAADAAIRRQLERANARLVSRLNGKPDLRAALKGVDPAQYAAVLGADSLAGAGIDPKQLLGEDYGTLHTQVDGWLGAAQGQALATAGSIVPLPASRVAAAAAAQETHRTAAWEWLAAALAGLAAARLFDPSPEPPPGESDGSYIVGASLVRAAVAIAGGFGTGEGSQGLGPDGLPVDPTERLGGIGTGTVINDLLDDGGATVEHWTWIYGASLRSFEPHVALEGATYATHDDAQLVNDGDWPDTDYFYVGDHVGCFPAGTMVSGPRPSGSTVRRYVGPVVDLETSSGVRLTATVNHPILTPRGWVEVGALDIGDEVIEGGAVERGSDVGDDDRQVPACIEDVAAAVGVGAGVVPALMPVAAEHFHGDGRYSDVAVVRSDRLLHDRLKSAGDEPVVDGLLVRGLDDGETLPGSSAFGLLDEGPGSAAHRVVGGGGLSEPLLPSHPGGSDATSRGPSAGFDPGADQEPTDDGAREAAAVSDAVFRLTGEVGVHKVTSIVRRDVDTHVYNLQTGPAWYLAERVVVHNCDCTEEPLWTSTLPTGDSDIASEEQPDQGVAASAGAVPPLAGSRAAIGRLIARHTSFEFSDDQPRDEHGRWVSTGASDSKEASSGHGRATEEEKAAAKERLDTVVSPAIKDAIANGQTSDLLFKDPATGGYTQERIAQQQEVINRLYAASNAPNDREAVMLGGIPGAGKSTSLDAAGINESNYLVLNPDDTRAAMLEAGMGIPVEGLSPQETGPLIHEEASGMTKQLADMAAADGKNVIWDATMDPRPTGDPAAGVLSKLGNLSAAGYTTDMVFVSTDPAIASDRALGRYASGIGSELGGRPIASSLGIVPTPDGIGNRAVFDSVKGESNQYWVYDNNGTGAPTEIEHGFGAQSG